MTLLDKDTNIPKRKNPVSVLLNDKEMRAMTKFCEKYKIKNRSKFIRETLMTEIIARFEADYPTLFSFEEMQGFAK